MRLILTAILMVLMGSPLGICSSSSQDAGPLGARQDARRGMESPVSIVISIDPKARLLPVNDK